MPFVVPLRKPRGKGMKSYATRADAVFAMCLLVPTLALLLMITSTLVYFAWLPSVRGLIPWLQGCMLLPFAVFIILASITRRYLLSGRVPNWSYIGLLASFGLVALDSLIWFKDPMHDIALFFGSHGRWGCTTVNPDGTPYYLIRDATVPWLLFAPPAIATAAHWLWSRLRRKSTSSAATTGRTPREP